MAEFCVRVGCKSFGVGDHVLHSAIGSVCGSVVDINWLEFNVERWHVASVKSNDVFPDFW